MKKPVFVDTAAWLALINKSDILHEKAKKVRDRLLKNNAQLLVTDYVIVEIANALSNRQFRSTAIQLITFLQTSKNIQIIDIDKEIYSKSWELYCSRHDKEWSLTDCTSFIVMKRNGIIEAFTSDHHFEQAGFALLIK